ncbi:MAG: hypothetical protein WD830_07440 [Chloroflexota bacterium]
MKVFARARAGARGNLRAVVAAALLLAIVPSHAALGYVAISTSGRTGAWTVNDSAAQASLRCIYQDQHLSRLVISPPTIKASTRRARKVGWQFQVLRAKWWQTEPDQWYVAYTSDIAKASATRRRAASFVPREWTIPDAFRTAYDSFKVQVIMRWFAADGTTQRGQTTIELEYYGLERAGEPFDPASTFGPAHCAGSLRAPAAPSSGTTEPPAGFVRMSHWQPYWKGFSVERVRSTITELVRMHQTGVVLTGMESRNTYALPPDVARYLTMFRDAGIKPYLALWVGKFTDAETATALRAWEAGNGQWAGIVLDVERGLEVLGERDRAAAVRAVDRFMARVDPVTPFLAYSTFAIPSDHPGMLYSELNSYSDVFMPQLYFSLGRTALRLLDRMQASVDYESSSWSEPPIPIVPIVNDWGDGVNLNELRSYIEISFSRYGAVSGWRLHPNMHEEVKDLWGSFAP